MVICENIMVCGKLLCKNCLSDLYCTQTLVSFCTSVYCTLRCNFYSKLSNHGSSADAHQQVKFVLPLSEFRCVDTSSFSDVLELRITSDLCKPASICPYFKYQ